MVCAPEKPIAPLWVSSSSLTVVKTDIEPSRGVDALADLQKIPFADNSYDIIWCHHVPPHVWLSPFPALPVAGDDQVESRPLPPSEA